MSGRPLLYLSLPGVAFILGVFWYRYRNNKRIECKGGGGGVNDDVEGITKSTLNGQIPNGSIKPINTTTTSATMKHNNNNNLKASKSMSIMNNGHYKHGQPDIEDDINAIAIRQFGKSAPINIIPNGNCCNGINLLNNNNNNVNDKSNAAAVDAAVAALQQNVVDCEVLKSKIQDAEHKILRSIDEDFENLSSPVDLPDSMHNSRISFYASTRHVDINSHDQPPVIIKATTTPKISPENSFLERNFVKSQEANNNCSDDLTATNTTISTTTRALSQSPHEYKNTNANNNNSSNKNHNINHNNNNNRRMSASSVVETSLLPVIQETKNEAQKQQQQQLEIVDVIDAKITPIKASASQEIVEDIIDETTTTTTNEVAANSIDTDNKRKVDTASPTLSLSSEQSGDSGKGASLPRSEAAKSAKTKYEFLFPIKLLGHLFGRQQVFINKLKTKSGANITLSTEETNEMINKVRICIVEGTESQVNIALNMIRQRLPLKTYPNFTMQRIHYALPQTVVPLSTESLINLQLNLIEGINNDVVVSAVINGGHIFVQQPLHPTHPSLALLQKGLFDSYSSCETPFLPGIELSAVCVTCVNGIWYRVQIVSADADDETRCVVRFLDFGGYLNVGFNDLRQIRTDFMSMPFQATECMLSNIEPADGFWSPESADILCKLTKGIVLQAQIAGYTAHNIPEVYLFACLGPNNVVFINKELVARNVAKWVDMRD